MQDSIIQIIESGAAGGAFAFSHSDWGAFAGVERIQSSESAAFSVYSPGFSEGGKGDLWGGFSIGEEMHFAKKMKFRPKQPEPAPNLPLNWREDPALWGALCAKIDASLVAGAIMKAVPARMRIASLTSEHRSRLIDGLCARVISGASERAYKFFLKGERALFFGATPELLFSRKNGEVLVPAIAGTRAVLGDSHAAAEALRASNKDAEEHRIVVAGILAALAELGLDPVAAKQPEVLDLGALLHLYTPVCAVDPGVERLSDMALLKALHPTAAIGGSPRDSALELLARHEGWDRGLFSAPILVCDHEKEHSFCLVAIRSALLTADALYQFAGAGYVEGSSSAQEWAETGAKMDSLAKILFTMRV